MAAALSGLFLFVLGGVPVFVYWIVGGKGLWPELTEIGVLAVVSFPIGIVFSRFLLRALPVRADGQRRIYLVCIVGAVFLIGIVLLTAILFAIPIDSAAPDGYPPGSAVAFIAWMLGAGIPFMMRHIAPRHFLSRSYVLFLRRFYSFSDRVIVGAVLKAAPAGSPVTFLLAPLSTAGDWNPYSVGMAGFKPWRPIHSLPIELHSVEPWEGNARTLIENAELVILDGTEGSGAISAEMAMIDDGGFAEKTLVLAPKDASTDGDSFADIGGRGSPTVRYQKTWLRALPGMLMGALGCAAVVLSVATGALTPADRADWEITDLQLWMTPEVALSTIIALLLFVVLFVRQTVDRQTEKALKRWLRRQEDTA